MIPHTNIIAWTNAVPWATMDVFNRLIAQIPGASWVNTDEKLVQFGLVT